MFTMVVYTSGQFQGWGSGKIDRVDYIIYFEFIS